jgi:hypothetical protein
VQAKEDNNVEQQDLFARQAVGAHVGRDTYAATILSHATNASRPTWPEQGLSGTAKGATRQDGRICDARVRCSRKHRHEGMRCRVSVRNAPDRKEKQ